MGKNIFATMERGERVDHYFEEWGDNILTFPVGTLGEFRFSNPSKILITVQKYIPLFITNEDIFTELALREEEDKAKEIVNACLVQLCEDFNQAGSFGNTRFDRALKIMTMAREFAKENDYSMGIMAETALCLILFDKIHREELEDDEIFRLLITKYLEVEGRRKKK